MKFRQNGPKIVKIVKISVTPLVTIPPLPPKISEGVGAEEV